MNSEELFAQIRLDELADAVSFKRITPIRYAEVLGVRPQLVYYRIRNHRITYEPCPTCGTKTIDVEEANSAFGLRVPGEAEATEAEDGGEVLETDPSGQEQS